MEPFKEPVTRADIRRLIMRQIAIFNGLNVTALDQPKVYAHYKTIADSILATIERTTRTII